MNNVPLFLGEGLAGPAEAGDRRAAEAEEAGGQPPPGGQRAHHRQLGAHQRVGVQIGSTLEASCIFSAVFYLYPVHIKFTSWFC